MSTSQRAVMQCGWGVKLGMVREWVAGKTLCVILLSRAISEHFGDKFPHKVIISHYTNRPYFPLQV